MISKSKSTVVAIYIDVDFYPPTINAILNLAASMETVTVICRNNSVKDFPFPANVRLKKIGKSCSVREMEKQSLFKKIGSFLQFTFHLLRYGRSGRTNLVILYDSFALYSFFLVRRFLNRKKIWYHNHDMPNKGMLSKFSIGGLAANNEAKAMTFIDFFSLPSKERLVYYPSLKKGLPVFILPNYPSLKVYTEKPVGKKVNNQLKIIYQGFIGAGHALEEIISLLKEDIRCYSLSLSLKGSVTEAYKQKINDLATAYEVTNKLAWLPIGPYSNMPSLTASFDVGIGINMNTDIVSKTQGTSSNKIYEYAASGLAVILYDSEQFTSYLSTYQWAYFTDGSTASIRKQLENIVEHINAITYEARKSFETGLNFEHYFEPVFKTIFSSL